LRCALRRFARHFVRLLRWILRWILCRPVSSGDSIRNSFDVRVIDYTVPGTLQPGNGISNTSVAITSVISANGVRHADRLDLCAQQAGRICRRCLRPMWATTLRNWPPRTAMISSR